MWRWLGLAGLEISFRQETLVIDPCFRRFPAWRMLLGRLEPTPNAWRFVRGCGYILVTHAHWDHLLDAPSLARAFSAPIAGSDNTVQLCRILGLPEGQLRMVAAGETITFGSFNVDVLPAEHERVPGFNPGALPSSLKPPLRARDYLPDAYYCYRIDAAGLSLMTDPGLNPSLNNHADVLFVQPHRRREYYGRLLESIKPRVIVPIHWDSLFRFSPEPPLSYLRPRLGWPPLSRVDLRKWAGMIAGFSPDTGVVIPRPFVAYGVPFGRDETS